MMMEQESHHQANNNDASQGVSEPLFHHFFSFTAGCLALARLQIAWRLKWVGVSVRASQCA